VPLRPRVSWSGEPFHLTHINAPVSIHVIVGLIWIAIGVTASYVPAARAARLDPSVALRDE